MVEKFAFCTFAEVSDDFLDDLLNNSVLKKPEKSNKNMEWQFLKMRYSPYVNKGFVYISVSKILNFI